MKEFLRLKTKVIIKISCNNYILFISKIRGALISQKSLHFLVLGAVKPH